MGPLSTPMLHGRMHRPTGGDYRATGSPGSWRNLTTMPALKGLQLSSDDVLILHHVQVLRIAHIDHLAALTALP